MSSAATVRPLASNDRYPGYCGLCSDTMLDLRMLTHFDTELPLGSQHLCGACVAHVLMADALLNHTRWASAYDAAPLTRPPLGCEADGDIHRR